MRWLEKTFGELSTDELYALLRLRQEVFVVEQRCPYLDLDGLDRVAAHLFAVAGEEVVAYARLFAPGVRAADAMIGRVVTKKSVRASGMGKELMRRAIAAIFARHGETPIRISAQRHLERFYGDLGFVRDGLDYLEDGIVHLPMRRP